ncbi:MAG: 4'-phosphopantetheinyl transferase superfamily protein [Bacteroidota bacterium]
MIAAGAGGVVGAGWLFERFPVFVEEMRLSGDVPEPHPLEAEQVAQAVRKRRIEFAVGRHCAHRALARLDMPDFILRNGSDRAPCWPAGVVGAITHTGRGDGAGDRGYCGVVVARRADLVTVGLDAEEATPLSRALWPHVLTSVEQRSLPDDAVVGGLRAKVIFSAKECFYKAQYALSRRFLRFHDVAVTVHAESQTFDAELTEAAPPGLPLARCRGRFLVGEEFLATGIALGA